LDQYQLLVVEEAEITKVLALGEALVVVVVLLVLLD
jgi:hypothetical protein